jgi:hypothetical protein
MSPSAHIQLDDSHWPLLVIRYEGTATDEEVARTLSASTRYLERDEPCVIIHDMSRAGECASLTQRHLQAEWLKRHDARLRQWVLGIAYVTNSAALRLMVSLLFHVKPLAMPHKTFPRLPDAVTWVAHQFQQPGIQSRAHELLAHSGGLDDASPA